MPALNYRLKYEKFASVVHIFQNTQNSFHVVVLQRTAKKCTKIQNARAQLLFCSLNLLFCGVLAAVAVVVCLRSLNMFKTLSDELKRGGNRKEILPMSTLRTIGWGCAVRFPKPLPYFRQEYDFPYPIYDLTKTSILAIFKTLFQNCLKIVSLV